MGAEYNQEIPRRILGDGSQNGRDPEICRPRLCCQESDQQEREEIWCVHIAARVSRNECHYSCKFRVILTHHIRAGCLYTRFVGLCVL